MMLKIVSKAGREGKEILSRTGPTVGNNDEGEIERRGREDYQTSEGVDERVDCESDLRSLFLKGKERRRRKEQIMRSKVQDSMRRV